MPVRRRASVRVAAAVVACVAALAACTNSDSPINRTGYSGSATASTVAGVQQVTLTAGDDYRFHPSTITVHPGRVRVILKNTGRGAPHDFQVSGFPATFVPLAAAGTTTMATFTTPSPGKYEFVCTIHTRQGQRGTLIVLPS